MMNKIRGSVYKMKADDYCGAKICKCIADEYDIDYYEKVKTNIPIYDISVEE